ncbi:MAG: hypothetical protein KU37_06850 [Sulfuricurvum sp. PC08-66]|nr:MAG: hypothetical protein KU37_06850 [Sulfuricurvum sp. PC08-66]
MNIVNCPSCHGTMQAVKLYCPACDISVKGRFTHNSYAAMPQSMVEFMEAFVLARGNIKSLESQLGISYPTVRAKIDALVEAMQGVVDARATAQVTQEEQAKATQKVTQTVQAMAQRH